MEKTTAQGNDMFRTREDEGRLKWLNLNLAGVLRGSRTISFTPGEFDGVDFRMTAHTDGTRVESVGEIKTVHRPYAKYENFMIDYAKVKNLQEEARADGRTPYLVCFFDDFTVVWDVSGIDLEGRKYSQYCTSTTAFYGRKRMKDEVWLVKEEAVYAKPTGNPTTPGDPTSTRQASGNPTPGNPPTPGEPADPPRGKTLLN